MFFRQFIDPRHFGVLGIHLEHPYNRSIIVSCQPVRRDPRWTAAYIKFGR
jgi:hypothetical protein